MTLSTRLILLTCLQTSDMEVESSRKILMPQDGSYVAIDVAYQVGIAFDYAGENAIAMDFLY